MVSQAASIAALADLGELDAKHLPRDGWGERLSSWLGTAIDHAVLRAVQFAIDRTLLPEPERVAAIRRSAAPFLDGTADPARFLDGVGRSATPPRATESYLGPIGAGIRIARRIHWDAADPMQVEHWLQAPGRTRGTIIAVHGFGMGHPRVDAIALQARDWFDAGLDVALFTLPRHGARTDKDTRFSGAALASGDIADLNATIRQSLHELLLLARMLREESDAPVGILGQSLGGYLAALLACRDPDLAFVVPIVPPACLGDLAWRFLAASRSARDTARAAFTLAELRTCFRGHSPLAYRPLVARERLLLVAGRGDRIVPPEHPQALWKHWEEPAIHWFGGSHLAPFGRSGIAQAVLGHLRRLDIL